MKSSLSFYHYLDDLSYIVPLHCLQHCQRVPSSFRISFTLVFSKLVSSSRRTLYTQLVLLYFFTNLSETSSKIKFQLFLSDSGDLFKLIFRSSFRFFSRLLIYSKPGLSVLPFFAKPTLSVNLPCFLTNSLSIFRNSFFALLFLRMALRRNRSPLL